MTVVKRRWKVVAAVALLCVVAAVGYLAQAPQTSTATTLVNVNVISSDPFNSEKAASGLLDAATEEQLARSSTVVQEVSGLLDNGQSAADIRAAMDATLIAEATVMRISFTAPTAEDAVRGANAIAEGYLAYRSSQAEARQAQIIDQLEDKREALRDDLTEVNQTLAETSKGSSAAAEARSERELLNIELSDLATQMNALSGVDTTGGTVLTAAEDNPQTTSPNGLLVLATGGAVGLVLGLVVAFVVNVLDRRVHDAYDVAGASAGAVLTQLVDSEATIPPAGPDLDRLRVLRERLLSIRDAEGSVFAVVDETRGGPPSDVGVNVAVCVAETGLQVALLLAEYDADFLREVQERLDLRPVSRESWGEVQTSALIRGLTVVMPATDPGAVEPESAGSIREGLVSDSVGRDLTIVALPPTASRASRMAAGRGAHSVVAVVSDRRTPIDALARLASEMRAVGAVVHGVVTVPARRALSVVRAWEPEGADDWWPGYADEAEGSAVDETAEQDSGDVARVDSGRRLRRD